MCIWKTLNATLGKDLTVLARVILYDKDFDRYSNAKGDLELKCVKTALNSRADRLSDVLQELSDMPIIKTPIRIVPPAAGGSPQHNCNTGVKHGIPHELGRLSTKEWNGGNEDAPSVSQRGRARTKKVIVSCATNLLGPGLTRHITSCATNIRQSLKLKGESRHGLRDEVERRIALGSEIRYGEAILASKAYADQAHIAVVEELKGLLLSIEQGGTGAFQLFNLKKKYKKPNAKTLHASALVKNGSFFQTGRLKRSKAEWLLGAICKTRAIL